MDEQSYSQGRRSAWLHLLNECLRELGYSDPAAQQAAWVSERAACIQALRRICAESGDNNWTDDLHLVDILEKHLRFDSGIDATGLGEMIYDVLITHTTVDLAELATDQIMRRLRDDYDLS